MKTILLATLLATVAVPAAATVVTFDEAPIAFFTTYSESGLTFASDGNAVTYYPGSGASNGTRDLIYCCGGALTISKTGGGAFTLNSLLYGNAFNDYGMVSNYVLNLAGGGTQSGSITGVGVLQTLSVNTLITSMVFSSPTDWMALDNISYDENVPVPEPAMLGLFGLGAIGLGLSRRRRRA